MSANNPKAGIAWKDEPRPFDPPLLPVWAFPCMAQEKPRPMSG